MKTALYGRVLFGASAVLFGVIALVWHDPYTWQSLTKILRLPFGAVVGNVLMVVLVAAGIALILPRTMRSASIVLVVVFALFALACVPAIVAAPAGFGPYDGFFEQFSLLSGAVAAYAATEPNAARSAAIAQAARLGLGLSTIVFMLAQLIYLKATAGLVPAWIPPNQMFWAILTTVAFGLAAVAILFNVWARPALRLMTLMIVLFGVLVWIPLVVGHPDAHINWSELALTLLIAGSAWTVSDALPKR